MSLDTEYCVVTDKTTHDIVCIIELKEPYEMTHILRKIADEFSKDHQFLLYKVLKAHLLPMG